MSRLNAIKETIIIVLLFAGLVVASFYVGKYIADKQVVPTAKPAQVVTTKATTTSTKVTVKSTPVTFTKVNNRGDQKIDPIKVDLTTTKVVLPGEEIQVVVAPDATYKAKLSPYKIIVYGTYNEKLDYGVGVAYECYHYSNVNLSIGAGTTGVVGIVGYTITQTMEGFIGVNADTKETSAVFGVGVRL